MNRISVWDFPGGAAGIAIVLAALLVLTVVSAWTTRKTVGGAVRVLMALTRFGAFGLLVYCLCAPRIESKKQISETKRYRIAVLTDESGSMCKPGFWKRSRFQDAQKYIADYLRNTPDGRLTFEHFRFADAFRKADISAATEPGHETDFFGMLAARVPRLENDGFDGVIYLTDGIDTLGKADPEAAFSALAGSRMRHIFVPMTAVLEAPPTLALKKIEAPTLAYLDTEVPLTFMVRRVNVNKRMNPRLILSRNAVAVGEFPLEPGTGFQTVISRIPVKSAGTDVFSAELVLDGRSVEKRSWTMEKTVRKSTRRVLVYNGALEYGNRFLKYVFLNDPSMKLDFVFAPGVIHTKEAVSGIRFDRRSELEKYDVIVLFNLNRKQISAGMEQVLREYVENGGGIIFITGNPMIAAEFANSPLEKLLPVTFSEKYNAQKRYDVRTAGIVRLITSGRRRPTDFDRALQRNSEMRYKKHPLRDFVLTQTGSENPIFKQSLPDGTHRLIIPRFEDFSPVTGAKPAANVLARFKDSDGTEHILMAYQNFGQGRCMVLATDPLWRWKLKTASNDPSFDLFWKNLFSWLSLGRNNDAQWLIPNRVMEAGEMTELYFLPGNYLPTAAAVRYRLRHEKTGETALVPEREKDRFRFAVPLTEPGVFRLSAEYDGKTIAAADFSVAPSAGLKQEDTAPEPDLTQLERLAQLSNVRVVSEKESPELDRDFPAERLELTEQSVLPLWNRPWIYLLTAGLILLEYFIRRRFGRLI